MKDRLGFSAWVNRPLVNPTQNQYVRFVRQPGGGLPDMLKPTREKFEEFQNKALKTSLSKYLDD